MNDREIKPIDHVFAETHKFSKVYLSIPSLIYRFKSKSEVLDPSYRKVVNHWQTECNFTTNIVE